MRPAEDLLSTPPLEDGCSEAAEEGQEGLASATHAAALLAGVEGQAALAQATSGASAAVLSDHPRPATTSTAHDAEAAELETQVCIVRVFIAFMCQVSLEGGPPAFHTLLQQAEQQTPPRYEGCFNRMYRASCLRLMHSMILFALFCALCCACAAFMLSRDLSSRAQSHGITSPPLILTNRQLFASTLVAVNHPATATALVSICQIKVFRSTCVMRNPAFLSQECNAAVTAITLSSVSTEMATDLDPLPPSFVVCTLLLTRDTAGMRSPVTSAAFVGAVVQSQDRADFPLYARFFKPLSQKLQQRVFPHLDTACLSLCNPWVHAASQQQSLLDVGSVTGLNSTFVVGDDFNSSGCVANHTLLKLLISSDQHLRQLSPHIVDKSMPSLTNHSVVTASNPLLSFDSGYESELDSTFVADANYANSTLTSGAAFSSYARFFKQPTQKLQQRVIPHLDTACLSLCNPWVYAVSKQQSLLDVGSVAGLNPSVAAGNDFSSSGCVANHTILKLLTSPDQHQRQLSPHIVENSTPSLTKHSLVAESQQQSSLDSGYESELDSTLVADADSTFTPGPDYSSYAPFFKQPTQILQQRVIPHLDTACLSLCNPWVYAMSKQQSLLDVASVAGLKPSLAAGDDFNASGCVANRTILELLTSPDQHQRQLSPHIVNKSMPSLTKHSLVAGSRQQSSLDSGYESELDSTLVADADSIFAPGADYSSYAPFFKQPTQKQQQRVYSAASQQQSGLDVGSVARLNPTLAADGNFNFSGCVANYTLFMLLTSSDQHQRQLSPHIVDKSTPSLTNHSVVAASQLQSFLDSGYESELDSTLVADAASTFTPGPDYSSYAPFFKQPTQKQHQCANPLLDTSRLSLHNAWAFAASQHQSVLVFFSVAGLSSALLAADSDPITTPGAEHSSYAHLVKPLAMPQSQQHTTCTPMSNHSAFATLQQRPFRVGDGTESNVGVEGWLTVLVFVFCVACVTWRRVRVALRAYFVPRAQAVVPTFRIVVAAERQVALNQGLSAEFFESGGFARLRNALIAANYRPATMNHQEWTLSATLWTDIRQHLPVDELTANNTRGKAIAFLLKQKSFLRNGATIFAVTHN